MENPIWDELFFQIFEKTYEVQKSWVFVSPKIAVSKKSTFFFEKSMSPLKILRIVLRSFLVLNDQNRSDSVFFKFGRRRAKRGPSEARSVYQRKVPEFRIPKSEFRIPNFRIPGDAAWPRAASTHVRIFPKNTESFRFWSFSTINDRKTILRILRGDIDFSGGGKRLFGFGDFWTYGNSRFVNLFFLKNLKR